MLADYNNVEFIHGDAKNIEFPDADIVVHEIFGHNVFDEYIYNISLNLHNGLFQGILIRKNWNRIFLRLTHLSAI